MYIKPLYYKNLMTLSQRGFTLRRRTPLKSCPTLLLAKGSREHLSAKAFAEEQTQLVLTFMFLSNM